MTATHELLATLRRLKMSGMLDTLEVRLDQARAGELGHLEFLQVLCEDELTRRDASALARRVRAARFDELSTLEEFDFAYNPKVPVAAIRDLATLGFVEAHESVIVYGPVGVGKSHIAQALGHLACRRGHSVTFVKANRVLADLSGVFEHKDGSRLHLFRNPLTEKIQFTDHVFLLCSCAPVLAYETFLARLRCSNEVTEVFALPETTPARTCRTAWRAPAGRGRPDSGCGA